MADDETTEVEHAEDGTEGERLARVEDKVDRLASLVEKILPTHEDAERHTEERLDRPSSVQEQVQAELAKAREAEERERAEAKRKSEEQELRDTVRQLAEKKPEPALRRATKAMWGKP